MEQYNTDTTFDPMYITRIIEQESMIPEEILNWKPIQDCHNTWYERGFELHTTNTIFKNNKILDYDPSILDQTSKDSISPKNIQIIQGKYITINTYKKIKKTE